MRTLAALLFIAGTAAVAVALARMPTVADGRIMAADRLEDARKDGAVGMECNGKIPVGRSGAKFTCVATLVDGATQVVDYHLKPNGDISWNPQPASHDHPVQKPASRDPRIDRP
jgi:hypothetical protein